MQVMSRLTLTFSPWFFENPCFSCEELLGFFLRIFPSFQRCLDALSKKAKRVRVGAEIGVLSGSEVVALATPFDWESPFASESPAVDVRGFDSESYW